MSGTQYYLTSPGESCWPGKSLAMDSQTVSQKPDCLSGKEKELCKVLLFYFTMQLFQHTFFSFCYYIFSLTTVIPVIKISKELLKSVDIRVRHTSTRISGFLYLRIRNQSRDMCILMDAKEFIQEENISYRRNGTEWREIPTFKWCWWFVPTQRYQAGKQRLNQSKGPLCKVAGSELSLQS